MKRVPVSTYRLQMHAHFGFADARDVLPYLEELGITDVYASPYLHAERGSTHGYNLAAYGELNPELGAEEAYGVWTDDMKARGMGHVLDVVPNHMGIATGENAWWNDVLENGAASLHAEYFDIEWHPPKKSLDERVLLPILGAQYGEALENGDLTLTRKGGALVLRYYDNHIPVRPRSWIPLLERAAQTIDLPPSDPSRMELESIVTELRHLPVGAAISDEERQERAREKEVAKRRLGALCEASDAVRAAVDAEVVACNGTKGNPKSFDRLDAILREQYYRLSYWRVAAEEINYRRFFDVNQLAAVRMELPVVFDAAHALVFRLIEEGRIQGLRLDHTDGLFDPADYFKQLQARFGAPEERPLYLVAEKILEARERLPSAWLIEGTTGYDFLAAVNGLWVDPASEAELTRTYEEYTGRDTPFRDVVFDCKRDIMRSSLSSEMHMLAQALERIAEADRRSRDFTLGSLTTAIIQTIAAFPVYRTYIRSDGSREPNDDSYVLYAVRAAKRRTPGLNTSVFDFLRDVLLLREHVTPERVAFTMRFQQMTGPVMAKGVEDTAFYRYNRLVSLNEVGGNPGRFGTSVNELHTQSKERLASSPLGMVATSTHDTKRGEEVRARISVLSEIPAEWGVAVARWRGIAVGHRTQVEDETYPSENDEYLFFQTALGALPFGAREIPYDLPDRVAAYMAKAAKEAKDNTSWVNPNEDYERALDSFVRGMLADADFVAGLCALGARISTAAATNALAQTVLKFASPGVADTYQGSEAWNLSLVDPDNRRPVDYTRLHERLRALVAARVDGLAITRELLGRYEDGDLKLFVTHVALAMRRAKPDLFLRGSYVPLDVDDGEHLVAFAREHEGDTLVCVVPRLSLGPCTQRGVAWPIGDVWQDRTLQLPRPGRFQFKNAFTGEPLESTVGGVLRVDEALRSFPVALLLNVQEPDEHSQ